MSLPSPTTNDDGGGGTVLPTIESSQELGIPSKVVVITKPPILPILGRVFILFTVLTICLCIAATWWSLGYTWIVEPTLGIIPIYECPQLGQTFISSSSNAAGSSGREGGGGQSPDGPRCQV